VWIDFRYLIDSFGNGLTNLSKQQYADLCAMKLNCLAFVNAPSVKQFKKSSNPSFINSDRTLNTAFLKAGGENENFVSYAPEDQDRFWRFNLLGMHVSRVPGALYHLDHYRGPDSTMNNPDSRASHVYWDRIKNYNKEQIIEHLKLDWK
jgi:hypothetical protein